MENNNLSTKKNNPSILKLRLSEFAYEINTNKRQFTKAIGVSESFLTSDGGITEEKILKIVSAFPQLNTHWLLTGNGSMLLSEDSEKLSEKRTILTKQKNEEERLVSNQEIKKILTKQRKEMSDLTEIVKNLSHVMELQIQSNDSNMDKTIGFMKEQLSTMNEAIKRVDTKTDEIKENVFTINRKVSNG